MAKLFVVVTCCLALCGCKPKVLSPDKLQAFILDEENGLQKSVEVNGTQVSLTFRPTDLCVHQENDGVTIRQLMLDSLRKKYSSYYYFILSISRSNEEALHLVNDVKTYSKLVETLSFRMPQYVTMTTAARDTIPVGDFMLNRTYGLGSSTDILFVFNKEKTKGTKWVQFNLNEFGIGLGNQRFRFTVDALENAPSIGFAIMD